MEIDKRVYEAGFTRDLIINLHSKTKLGHYSVEKVHLINDCKPISDTLFTLQLEMRYNNRYRQMTIDVTESKLLKIKRSLVLESLGL